MKACNEINRISNVSGTFYCDPEGMVTAFETASENCLLDSPTGLRVSEFRSMRQLLIPDGVKQIGYTD